MSMRYRKVPSEKAGYVPGAWVVQYYDKDMRLWFDMSDPLTESEADDRMKTYHEEEGK